MKLDTLDNYRKDDLPLEKTIMESVNFFNSRVLVVGKPAFLEKILARTTDVTATENFEWQFKKKHFDVVLVYLTFSRENLSKVLWKMYESMRSKSKLVILNHSENPFAKLARKLGLEAEMPSEKELKEALFDVGFRITHLEKLRQFYQFSSVAEATAAIKVNGLFGKHVPAEQMGKVESFLKRKDSLRLPAENHLIIAEKMTFE